MRIRTCILILSFTLSVGATLAQDNKFIDPTGIYRYAGKTIKKNGETYGYFGNAKVLLLDTTSVIVNFFICKGAPSYNSGSFVDTLHYEKNQVVYNGDGLTDSTCKLEIKFARDKFFVQLFSQNINWACGFGHGVDAYGNFKKVTSKKPTSEEILEQD